ncbi:MAG: GGDEF domain-containing protein [Planctomycetes bacterium]|nr:GGDEF domain-containing protein [Planctomycetota bacterium]
MKKRAEEVSKTSRLAITVVIVVMTLLFLLLVVIIAMRNERIEAERERQRFVARHAAGRITTVLDGRFNALADLADIIQEDGGGLDRFLSAAAVFTGAPDVVAVYAAPDGIVAAAVTEDDSPGSVDDVIPNGDAERTTRDVINKNRAKLSRPFSGMDGDSYLYGCHPLTLDGEPWGAVTMLLSLGRVMEATFLGGVENYGYAVALTSVGDGTVRVLWSRGALKSRDPVRQRLTVKNVTWDLVVHRVPERMDVIQSWLYVAGLCLVTLLVCTLYYFYLNLRQVKTLMETMAMTDGLTGLPNRRATLKALDRVVAEKRRSGGSFVLLYMDLNGFKLVNDSHGHEKGDQVLKKTAEILQDSVRDHGHVGRVGGDEFVLVLEDVTETRLARILEILGKRLEMVVTGSPDTVVSVRVSASFGAAFYPRDGEDAPALLQKADMLMYRRKKRNERHRPDGTVQTELPRSGLTMNQIESI